MHSPAPAGGPAPATYREVKAEILRRIRARDWAPGALLPPETELAATFGVARATVNRAMRELAEDGVLDRRRRAGTRVSAAPVRRARVDIPQTRAEVEATGASYRYARVGRDEGPVPGWLAAALGLPPGARAVHLTAMHYAGARPWQFEERWIFLDAVPAAAAEPFEAVGPNEWLIAAVPFSEAEIVFSAARADAALAGFLGISEGDPVFRAERTTWLDGRPVTRAVLSYPPGHRMTTRL
jgi:GntR family histidine utilization transcriptional repressor